MNQIAGKLTRDGWLLFATRCSRMFAYGMLSVILVLYLVQIGLTDGEIAFLLTFTLFGDILISLSLTTTADRFGRRRTLIAGAVLMVLAGFVFASTDNLLIILVAATIGVISPSGNEIGPFLSVEQAALSQIISDERRTDVFAWYNLTGSFATGFGALTGGTIVSALQHNGFNGAAAYRPVLWAYASIGIVIAAGFLFLSKQVEAVVKNKADTSRLSLLGLHESRGKVLRLSMLFSLDAFGGGFVIQSLMAYWFRARFQVDLAMLGSIFLVASLLAGISALAAGWLARRIGLVNTMVFTHLPANVLLILVPLMPNLWWAVGLLMFRSSISQMDVPTRQAYTMAVVLPDERSAAAGITAVARSVGASISPMIGTILFANPHLMSVPFFLAGGVKIVYDLLLYNAFSKNAAPKSDD